MSVKFRQKQRKAAADALTAVFDFTDLLESGETISGTPTVVASSTNVTTGSVAVTTAAISDVLGRTVAVGKGIVAKISAGVAGVDYTLTVTVAATTGGTVGQVIERVADLLVR